MEKSEFCQIFDCSEKEAISHSSFFVLGFFFVWLVGFLGFLGGGGFGGGGGLGVFCLFVFLGTMSFA